VQISGSASPSALLIALIVATLSMMGPFTIDTYLPSFPAIAADLVASPVELQQTMGIYLLAFALTTLVYGPLSDAYGRRSVAMGSLVTYSLASLGAALAGSIEALLFWRMLQGASAAAGVVIGRAMVRDAFSGKQAQQVLAQAMLIFAVAPAIAPMIGGLLQDWSGWRAVFWFLMLYGLLALALLGLRAPETLPPKERSPFQLRLIVRHYGLALRHGRFMGLVLAFSLNFGGFFLYIAAAPEVLYEHLGLGVNDFWVQFVPMVVGLMLGSFSSGRMAGRISSERTVHISYLVMLVAGLFNVLQALFLTPAPWNVLAPLVLYAFAVSFSMPSLTLMALDCFPHHRGMAAAMQSFLQVGVNALVAALLVPLLMQHLAALAAGMLSLTLAGLLAWFWVGCCSTEAIAE
jgi:DHA1 family bicyclomycin/chloramphenicol resistance-like MFS transporter